MDFKEFKDGTFYNADCMDVMKDFQEKKFDLCLTDPPYGKKYARGKNGFGNCDNRPDKKSLSWDNAIPEKKYFEEIFRISKNQIIFGGNYFSEFLPASNCWIIWDKIGENVVKSPFADVELAWTSFNKVCKKYTSISIGFIKNDRSERIHPTQKPVDLFGMILRDFSKEGDLIFDPFSGSGTTAIACHRGKRRFVCIEKDKEYFEMSVKRYEDEIRQGILL